MSKEKSGFAKLAADEKKMAEKVKDGAHKVAKNLKESLHDDKQCQSGHCGNK